MKQQKCAAIVTKGARFVPFVMDTCGALSQTAVTTLKAIALYAQRLGTTRTAAGRIILGRLSCCVVRGVAAIAALGWAPPVRLSLFLWPMPCACRTPVVLVEKPNPKSEHHITSLTAAPEGISTGSKKKRKAEKGERNSQTAKSKANRATTNRTPI